MATDPNPSSFLRSSVPVRFGARLLSSPTADNVLWISYDDGGRLAPVDVVTPDLLPAAIQQVSEIATFDFVENAELIDVLSAVGKTVRLFMSPFLWPAKFAFLCDELEVMSDSADPDEDVTDAQVASLMDLLWASRYSVAAAVPSIVIPAGERLLTAPHPAAKVVDWLLPGIDSGERDVILRDVPDPRWAVCAGVDFESQHVAHKTEMTGIPSCPWVMVALTATRMASPSPVLTRLAEVCLPGDASASVDKRTAVAGFTPEQQRSAMVAVRLIRSYWLGKLDPLRPFAPERFFRKRDKTLSTLQLEWNRTFG